MRSRRALPASRRARALSALAHLPRNRRMRVALLPLLLLPLAAAALPEGYWPHEKRREVLDKTQEVELAPSLAGLTPGERTAVAKLVAAGRLMQTIYEAQRHPEAARSLAELQKLDRAGREPAATQELLTLYRL